MIDDANYTLMLKEQCFFTVEDYDAFVQNPIKTLWENVLPRKYSLFNSDTEVGTLMNTLGKFFQYAEAMGKARGRLAEECGVPSFSSLPNGGAINIAMEALYDFLRGMKGLSSDLRRCPEKVMAFIETFHGLFVKPSIQQLQKVEEPTSAFTLFSPMLSQNLLSAKQFGKYYWPHFKEIADKVVETDNTMYILSEGTTEHITEYLQELPKGHFCVYVEMDDIFRARKRLPNLCLWGGIPLPLLASSTKQECIDYVKKVIDEVGCDGGLILCTNKFAGSPRDCNRENLLAVSEFVRNYE